MLASNWHPRLSHDSVSEWNALRKIRLLSQMLFYSLQPGMYSVTIPRPAPVTYHDAWDCRFDHDSDLSGAVGTRSHCCKVKAASPFPGLFVRVSLGSLLRSLNPASLSFHVSGFTRSLRGADT